MLVAAAFVIGWLEVHARVPIPADADVFTHLTVARHLVHGDGFTNDVVYPLSVTFAWGRAVPQPLVDLQPAFAIALALPYLAAGEDPAATLAWVRWLGLGWLAIAATVGTLGLVRRGAMNATAAWLLLLVTSPLLALGVAWGWGEILVATLLLGLWVRWRDRDATTTPGRRSLITDGALAGLVAMVRLDLFWVPLLWWRGRPRPRQLVWVAVGWLVIAAPWFVRTTRVAGTPLAGVLSQAVELDLRGEWWTYPTLRGLTPAPFLANLRAHRAEALVKVRHGARFFVETLGQWLPWLVWIAGAVLLGLRMRGSWRKGRARAVIREPGVTLVVTLAALIAMYALFSQEVRHLIVLVPVVGWEIALLAAHALPRSQGRAARMATLAALTVAALTLIPCGIGGEQKGLDDARREGPALAALVRQAQALPPGPVFTDNAAVLWLADRAGIWSPRDRDVEMAIRRTVPDMADAPWLRLDAPARQ